MAAMEAAALLLKKAAIAKAADSSQKSDSPPLVIIVVVAVMVCSMLMSAPILVLASIFSSGSGGSMVEVAAFEVELGNHPGGEKYWNWFGFEERVEWCAVFVTWCADQCDYLTSGILPRFSSCTAGIRWFQERELWQDAGYIPEPGDLIFFDWEEDGVYDHVGIVEFVEDGRVHTIEGNSDDQLRRKSYGVNSEVIVGYGTPQYPMTIAEEPEDLEEPI